MFDEMKLRGIDYTSLLDELPTSSSSLRERERHEAVAKEYWDFRKFDVVPSARPKAVRMSVARARINMYERRAKQFRLWEQDIELAQVRTK